MSAARPRKTQPRVDAQRVLSVTRQRFNPIRGLTPDILATYLDEFEAGYLGRMAQLMEKIEQRDDTIVSVGPKRRLSIARHGWEIVSTESSPEAERQRAVAEFFFGNLTATSSVDEELVGDVALLMEQMLDALGKRWSVHEIVWQPRPQGLTAEFRHVPLWFFEHTTSRLRYLSGSGSLTGEALEDGGWLVTVGPGLMIACSILYMFKRLPLQDLLNYCERYAVPGLHGKTDAAKGSTEWNTLRDALAAFSIDWALITNTSATIEPVNAGAHGELPHSKLIERMDRAMSCIWRGGDLATLSAGDSVGATTQQGEKEILEDGDIALVESAINRRLMPYLIRYTRGPGPVLVEFRIARPARKNVADERLTDEFLVKLGCPVSITDLLERYGRPTPEAGEELATLPAAVSPFPPALANARVAERLLLLANANATAVAVERRLVAAGADALAQAQALSLRPVAARLEAALEIEDPILLVSAISRLREDLPDILREINREPAAAAALENTLAAAIVNGYVEASAAHTPQTTPGVATPVSGAPTEPS
jgi:phage gp29-like protein